MLDSFRELIDELLSAPAALRALGIGTTNNQDALQSLALLTERDRAVLEQIQQMVRTNDPVLRAPLAKPSDEALAGTPDDLLNRFDTWRGELVSLLMNLTLKDWERTAIDHTGAQITVADLVETHVEFDEELRETFESLFG